MKHWSKKVPGKDIFNLNKLFFIINDDYHWTCAVVLMEKRTIMFYDSKGSRGAKYLFALSHYLADEYLDKKKQQLDMRSWRFISDQSKTPQQINSKYSNVVLLTIF